MGISREEGSDLAAEDQIEQVRRLQASAQEAATRRATAIALQQSAQTQLNELLASNEVATVEELEAKATAAEHHAATLIAQAAAALGVAP